MPPLDLRGRRVSVLLSGETIATFGDAFFSLAVVWVVWTETQSVLQTAIVQVVWHLSTAIFSPLGGALADRGNQRGIMAGSSVLASGVVGLLAIGVAIAGVMPLLAAFGTIFVLNSLFAFSTSARAAIFPDLVGRENLVATSGLFSWTKQVASIVGNASGGLVVASLGSVWALAVVAGSFLLAGLSVLLAVPKHLSFRRSTADGRRSLAREILEGWRAISVNPILLALVVLSLLVNLSSFLGPLWPALVDRQLHGGAIAYGFLNAAGIVGGICGGLTVRRIERAIGTGQAVILGWLVTGIAVLGVALSTSLVLTGLLNAIWSGSAVVAGVASFSLTTALAAPELRGRVFGISRALVTVAIPLGALIGAWAADTFGITPMFLVGSMMIIATSIAAWSVPALRSARL